MPAPSPQPLGWITADDIIKGCTSVTENTEDLDLVAQAASLLMYELSGRLYPGEQTRTVRPCKQSCGCWGGSLAGGATYWSWTLSSLQGWGWYNDCGDSCGCGSESYIRLAGYPVWQIDQVKIDGAVIAASEYRLDSRRKLIRMASASGVDQMWPACQDLSLPDTSVGTYSVTYRWGENPPELGKRAAVQIACEIWTGFQGGASKLPSQVSKVVRQGITVERIVPIAQLLREGGTGMALVDMFMAQVNPTGARRARPTVYSPDLKRARKVG